MAEKAGTVSSAARSLRAAVRAPRLGSSEARTYKPLEGRTSRGFLVCEPPRLERTYSASTGASATIAVATHHTLSPRCSEVAAALPSLSAHPARTETVRVDLGQRAPEPERDLRRRSIRTPRPMTLDDRLAGLVVLLVVLGSIAFTAWSLV